MISSALGVGHTSGPGSGSVLGVYAGPEDPPAVSDFAARLGGKPRFAMDFLDGTSWSTIDDPSQLVSQWAGSGYTMIWGVPILPSSGASLATGATGAYDGYFATLADAMVAHGQGSSIIRMGWEFNGGWFPWAANGQASAFVGYWQQIVTTMRSVSGANFTFEWNPTRGDLGVGDLANYYPGDAYVNYVGLDVYDTEWASYPGMPAEFENMETQPYGLDWLASFAAAHDKPMVFPEWGLGWGTCSASGQPISASGQVCGGDDADLRERHEPVDRHAQRLRGDLLGLRFEQHRPGVQPQHGRRAAGRLRVDTFTAPTGAATALSTQIRWLRLEKQALEERRQQPLDARFDIEHRVGEATIAAIEGSDLRRRRGHLPERARHRGRRRDEVDDIALAQGGQQSYEPQRRLQSSSVWVTNLNSRTASTETFLSRLSGACASKSQKAPRAASVRANTAATPAGVGVMSVPSSVRSASDHSCHASAVKRRKISSRVSK